MDRKRNTLGADPLLAKEDRAAALAPNCDNSDTGDN
jgi:hypothetical protein